MNVAVEATRPVVERDVFTLRLCDATWCAIFRHAQSATVAAPGPTEVTTYSTYLASYNYVVNY